MTIDNINGIPVFKLPENFFPSAQEELEDYKKFECQKMNSQTLAEMMYVARTLQNRHNISLLFRYFKVATYDPETELTREIYTMPTSLWEMIFPKLIEKAISYNFIHNEYCIEISIHEVYEIFPFWYDLTLLDLDIRQDKWFFRILI